MHVMSKIYFVFVMFCLSLSAYAQNSASAANSVTATPNTAGKIDLMEGDVRVFDSKKAPRTVHVGDKIFEGDSIVTGKDGEIHMTMEDTGFIAVRPDTKMQITQYQANGDNQDKGVFGLLVGSFRSISGWIGKYQPKSYVIRTPTATIGIRGTDHEPKVIPEGSTEGDPGTYDKVNTGGTFIRTPQGSVDVTEHHAAFAPRAGGGALSRPRVLTSVPNFYRPTRNEHLIEGKHEQIQRTLQQRREEKHQQVGSSRHAQTQRQMKQRNVASRTGKPVAKAEQHPFMQRLAAAKAAIQQRAATSRSNQGNKVNEKEKKSRRDSR
jgi:hypothetical protein